MRKLLSLFVLLALFPLAAPASAQQTAPCQFVLGFKTLHDLAPANIGDCQDNQNFADNGDAQQHSTKGLLAWRKADNWTAFTNGYMTWINGPSGLVSRLNVQRYPWEADYGAPNTQRIPVPLVPNGLRFTDAFDHNLVLTGPVQADDGSGHVINLPAKGQWVNVYFWVRNNQTTPASLTSDMITVGDKQGRVYSSQFDLRQADSQESLFTGTVAPGATVNLRLTLDVAKDVFGGVMHIRGGNDIAVL